MNAETGKKIKKSDVAAVLVLLLVVSVAWSFADPALFDFPGSAVALSILFTLCIGALPFVYGFFRRIPFSAFACPGAFSWRLCVGSLLCMIGTMLFSALIAFVFVFVLPFPFEGFNENIKVFFAYPFPVIFVSIAVLPAICEELFFRGFVLRGLIDNRRDGTARSSAVAVAVCAFMFAAFHFDVIRFLPVFGCGLILSYVGYAANSLVLPMVMHFFNNAVALTLSYALDVWTRDVPVDSFTPHSDAWWGLVVLFGENMVTLPILCAIYLYCVGALVLFGISVIKKETEKRSRNAASASGGRDSL